MKNHQSRPTGSSPFPEANTTSFPEANATSFKGNRGRREGHNFKSNDNNVGRYEKEKNSISSKKFESSCYRCGMTNHW
jgi:hypothetical protein